MKRICNIFLVFAAAAAVMVSCAKETSESNLEVSKRIFDSWMTVNGYDTITPTSVGIYITEDKPGTGKYVTDSVYVFVKYSRFNMDGTISSHNQEDLAIQLGTWNKKTRFTPTPWYLPNSGLGVRDMLKGTVINDSTNLGGMRVGGTRTAIIPYWLKDPESGEEVTASDGSVYIYTITVTDLTKDIVKYQVDSLEQFKKHYPRGILANVDSLHYGMYAKTFYAPVTNDTIPEGNSISLRYIGKYLDGKVFDTNMKDTAKFYGLYDESNSYSSMSFSFYKDSTNAVGNNTTVKGFALALTQAKRYGDHVKTFFTSQYGYGITGSGNIPAYEPLYFDIWIEEE